MLGKDLKNEIPVKTKDGDFRLLKDRQLVESPSDELVVPLDDMVKFDPAKAEQPGKVTSNFYIDIEDEHEARQLGDKEQDDKNRKIKEFIETTVKNLINSAGLEETAWQNLQLKNIVISRLKDVRSLAETKEALMRPLGFNGQTLNELQINQLLKLIEKERDRVEEVIKTGKLFGVEQEIKPSPVVKRSLPKQEIRSRPVAAFVQKKEERPAGSMSGVKYEKKHEVVSEKELSQHITTGPVEEIKSLKLDEFRRLGASPKEATERILQKIDLLGDESIIKRSEGIKAWHDSEVYRLYLAIGATSMAEKKPIEQVIREYKEAGKPYLAPEEFNEVADLNSKLSY